MKKIVYLILLKVFVLNAESQENSLTYKQPDFLFKTDFTNLLGGGCEFKLKDDITFSSYFGFSWSYSKDNLVDTSYFLFLPRVESEVKKYYNFSKRTKHNRKILNFSGNYFGLNYSFPISNKPVNISYLTLIQYNMLVLYHGWQRNIYKHFYIDLALGVSLNHSPYLKRAFYAPYAKFKFGLNIPLKK